MNYPYNPFRTQNVAQSAAQCSNKDKEHNFKTVHNTHGAAFLTSAGEKNVDIIKVSQGQTNEIPSLWKC